MNTPIHLRPGTIDAVVYEEVYERNLYLKDFILRHTIPAALVVDAGAHIGTFTLKAAELLDPMSMLAIEPEPANFHSLAEAVMKAGYGSRTRLEDCAVGAASGVSVLRLSDNNTGGHVVTDQSPGDEETTVHINVRTLDDLTATWHTELEVAVLKLDVEGAELDVIRGAQKMLTRTRTVVGELHEDYVSRAALGKALSLFTVAVTDDLAPFDLVSTFYAVRTDLLSPGEESSFLRDVHDGSADDTVWKLKRIVEGLMETNLDFRTRLARSRSRLDAGGSDHDPEVADLRGRLQSAEAGLRRLADRTDLMVDGLRAQIAGGAPDNSAG